METNTLTADQIADEIVSEQQRKRQLEQQHAQVEQALGNGEGDPAALAVQHVTIGAQIKAAAQRIRDLGAIRKDTERQEAINEFARLTSEYRDAENDVKAINEKIAKHEAAIVELRKQRVPLAEKMQVALGRRSTQQQRLHAMGIQGHELPGN